METVTWLGSVPPLEKELVRSGPPGPHPHLCGSLPAVQPGLVSIVFCCVCFPSSHQPNLHLLLINLPIKNGKKKWLGWVRLFDPSRLRHSNHVFDLFTCCLTFSRPYEQAYYQSNRLGRFKSLPTTRCDAHKFSALRAIKL